MSLFVGNISKHVKSFELEEDFNRFGRCDIKRHGSYAFIEYESEKGAEDAKNSLNGVNMKGLDIGIEWSKRSNRFDPRASQRPPRRDNDAKCYNCDRIGHFARDCRSRRRSRSRSHERRRRNSRSYSPRDRRRDRDYDRRRSPDRRRRSPDRRDNSYDRPERRDSYDRRDDRRGGDDRRDDWRDRKGGDDRRRSGSFGSRSPEQRRRSPAAGDDERRRSPSRDSGFKDGGKRNAAADDVAERPNKSPAEANDRQQTDEREIDNGAANTNDRAPTENPEKQPEEQQQPRSPAGEAPRTEEPKE